LENCRIHQNGSTAMRSGRNLAMFALTGVLLLLFHAQSSGAQAISHLPEAIQDDIRSWRARLEGARCLKVVMDTEQTWARLHELDEAGNPVVAHQERFQVHSWMTPEMVWMVVFARDADGNVDTTTPHYQQLWKRDPGMVWDRIWHPDEQVYYVRRYACTPENDCEAAYGPANSQVPTSRACLYATVMQSWLGGPRDLARRTSLQSVDLYRSPNLAIVPPDPSRDGVWLDVFDSSYKRDNHQDDDSRLYRRNDFMLLARNEAGDPEVREWRTIVTTDPDDNGRKPTQITAIRRLSYSLFDAPPAELLAGTTAFIHDVDQAVADFGPDALPEVEGDPD